MEKTHILYIGMHPEILETVVRIANKNEAWQRAAVERDPACAGRNSLTGFTCIYD
jgi:hypothetical protein